MSRKHSLPPHDMLLEDDMSAAVTSPPTNVSQIDQCVIIASWTGSAVGSFTVEGAQVPSTQLRANSPLPASITWTALDFGAPIEAAGVDDEHQLVLTQIPFTHIRVVFTPTSGSGSLSARISGKTVGA